MKDLAIRSPREQRSGPVGKKKRQNVLNWQRLVNYLITLGSSMVILISMGKKDSVQHQSLAARPRRPYRLFYGEGTALSCLTIFRQWTMQYPACQQFGECHCCSWSEGQSSIHWLALPRLKKVADGVHLCYIIFFWRRSKGSCQKLSPEALYIFTYSSLPLITLNAILNRYFWGVWGS